MALSTLSSSVRAARVQRLRRIAERLAARGGFHTRAFQRSRHALFLAYLLDQEVPAGLFAECRRRSRQKLPQDDLYQLPRRCESVAGSPARRLLAAAAFPVA